MEGLKQGHEVVYKALKQDEHLDECVWIDDGFPQRNYK